MKLAPIFRLCTFFLIAFGGLSFAKSLYVNANLNAGSPIAAYDIQLAPNYLVYQMTSGPTQYGGVGLAIDTDSEILFVTFEGYSYIKIVDAKTLAVLGTVTTPNASDLAGIVVDQENQKVYAVDRATNHLYIYSWDAVTKTLTNDIVASPYYQTLAGVSQAYGIALDEVHDLLYVGDLTTSIKVFDTGTWSPAGTVPVTQAAMGVAVDVQLGIVYSGNAYPGYGGTGHVCKYDLGTSTETILDIRSLTGGVPSDNVVGLAVDPSTGLLYITTGNQGSGGSDRIIVFQSDLTMLFATGDIGDPTGLVIPGKDISYNPLNLMITDGLDYDLSECVYAGGSLTYSIHYDNLANAFVINNAAIVDQLPPEVDFVSASGGGIYNAIAGTVTWTLGTLPANDPGGTLLLVVDVKPSVTGGSTFVDGVTIDSDETPPTTKNEQTLVCLNRPPVAVCHDITVYTTNNCMASVIASQVDNGSYDPDGDPIALSLDDYGPWPAGDYPVLLTVEDIHAATSTCAAMVTVVEVLPNPTITVTPSPAVDPGGDPETIYIGYGPQTVNLAVSEGEAWSWTSDPAGFTSTLQNPDVSPTVTTKYMVDVTNAVGCTNSTEVTIHVVDIRCGNKMDKVTIAHFSSNHCNTLCIAPSAVPAHLVNHGDHLGPCPSPKAGQNIIGLPDEITLQQNYPNPFNGATVIAYSLPSAAPVTIRVFDLLGREVAKLVSGEQQAGFYNVQFDARNLPFGTYIYKLESNNVVMTRVMTLMH